MKAHCQYSGVPFTLLQFSNTKQKDPVICVHPIFYADTSFLLSLYETYERGEMSSLADQRLLFLALLNKTEQIDWTCTADPAPSTVAQNMKSLYHHICWLSRQTKTEVPSDFLEIAEKARFSHHKLNREDLLPMQAHAEQLTKQLLADKRFWKQVLYRVIYALG